MADLYVCPEHGETNPCSGCRATTERIGDHRIGDIEFSRVSASVAPAFDGASLSEYVLGFCPEKGRGNAILSVEGELTLLGKNLVRGLVARFAFATGKFPDPRHWQPVSEPAPASTVAPQEQSEASITGEGRLIIKLLLDWRKSYSEDIFAPWTTEEAQAVHAQFPGVVDRISADSARSIINRIIGDIQAGKHKTWEDSTTNRYDAIYVSTAFVSPVATQDMASTARKVAEGEDTK